MSILQGTLYYQVSGNIRQSSLALFWVVVYKIDVVDDAKCMHSVTLRHICVFTSWTLIMWSHFSLIFTVVHILQNVVTSIGVCFYGSVLQKLLFVSICRLWSICQSYRNHMCTPSKHFITADLKIVFHIHFVCINKLYMKHSHIWSYVTQIFTPFEHCIMADLKTMFQIQFLYIFIISMCQISY